MIRLDLSGPTGAKVTLGPAPWFRVAGNFIRQGPHANIVGTFRHHHWEAQSRLFSRIDCPEPVLVHFEDAAGGRTEDFGPFAEFYSQDGSLHADGDIFGKFIDETQLWHCLPTETYWPALVVKAAPAAW